MIHIGVNLVCDECRTSYRERPRPYVGVLLRCSIEAMRQEATQDGWCRYRKKNTGPNGDYCPRCVKAHTAAAQQKTRRSR